MAIRRIGQILVDLGYLTDEQLEMVLEEQAQRPGTLLGKVALEMSVITEEQLLQAIAEQMGMHIIELADRPLPEELRSKISEAMAQLYRVIPVAFDDDTLTVATCDPQNLRIQDELYTLLGYKIRLVVAAETDINKAIEKYYSTDKETMETIITDIESDMDLKAQAEKLMLAEGPMDLTGIEALAESAPVRKLLNMVLLLAIKDHASDIHFEPFEDEFRIRIKADGVLFEMVPPPRHLAFAITTRIKVMANLDIA